jgi:hypothetical protein
MPKDAVDIVIVSDQGEKRLARYKIDKIPPSYRRLIAALLALSR